MTEEPTRELPRSPGPGAPAHGRVGPADPRADPVTQSLRPLDEAEAPTVRTSGGPGPGGKPAAPPQPGVTRTRTGWLWTGLILSAVVLLFLLVFILQNDDPVRITFLGASGTLPTGVALLFAAVAGLLLVAIPGGLRILQLRRAAGRNR